MSKLKPPHDPVEAIGEAYELLLERALGEETAEGEPKSRLGKALQGARDKAVELGEVSREEADRLYQAMVRDLHWAGERFASESREIKDWLGFEAGLVEDRLLALLQRGADQTTEQLLELKELAEASTHYRSGEITGPGTLVCESCGERLHFHRPGHVPPCPKCHGVTFHREGEPGDTGE